MIIESAIEISAVINRLALIRATFLRAWWIAAVYQRSGQWRAV
jgi:hypothetical protein